MGESCKPASDDFKACVTASRTCNLLSAVVISIVDFSSPFPSNTVSACALRMFELLGSVETVFATEGASKMSAHFYVSISSSLHTILLPACNNIVLRTQSLKLSRQIKLPLLFEQDLQGEIAFGGCSNV